MHRRTDAAKTALLLAALVLATAAQPAIAANPGGTPLVAHTDQVIARVRASTMRGAQETRASGIALASRLSVDIGR